MARICIAGVGAIGSVLAARLAAAGHAVSVLARGRTVEVLAQRALLLDDLEGRHEARMRVGTSVELGVQDGVFICCKSHDVPSMAPLLPPLLGERTWVVPAINGIPWWWRDGSYDASAIVDPLGVISRHVPAASIIGAVVYISAHVVAPGHARSTTAHRMIIGEPAAARSQRLETLAHWLGEAGIDTTMSGSIRDDILTKLIGNLSAGPLSVLTHATLGEIYGDAQLRAIAQRVINELLMVCAACQARLTVNPAQFLSMAQGYGEVETSMLQDFKQGRTLELQGIADAVIALAECHQIDMPTTRLLSMLARHLSARRGAADTAGLRIETNGA